MPRVLSWGDVAFWLAVLLVALRSAPHTRYFFAGLALSALSLSPITYARSRREERVLAAAFGAEYERYRERTWF